MANNESRLVYSTDSGRIKQAPTEQVIESDGTVRIRRETKGRKGKGVTVIKELAMTQAALEACAQQLKKHCGTGGSVKGAVIEIQGDQRLKIQTFLAGMQIKSVVSGKV